MNNWPSNWEQCESEYNEHYDPYAEKCPECGTEDNFDNDVCFYCGYEIEVE